MAWGAGPSGYRWRSTCSRTDCAGSHKVAGDVDYFHGRLLPGPSQQWLLDDGWAWAPVGIPAVWSLHAWLDGNRWESEDGPSRKRLAQGDGWDQPCVWLGPALCVAG